MNTNLHHDAEHQKLDESTELLSRALKRKFIELDEITQRLRLRLSDVTKDESDTSNDEFADEFERDINTLCVEDDYNTINLQIETDDFNARPVVGVGLLQQMQSGSSDVIASTSTAAPTTSSLAKQLNIATGSCLSAVDKQLIEGKQHIDCLLEKLSLMTAAETEAARYVSGCSEPTDILKELGIEARPNINAQALFNPDMFQQIYEGVEGQSSAEGSSGDYGGGGGGGSSSSSTLLTTFSECRRAPDGAGTSMDDKTKTVP